MVYERKLRREETAAALDRICGCWRMKRVSRSQRIPAQGCDATETQQQPDACAPIRHRITLDSLFPWHAARHKAAYWNDRSTTTVTRKSRVGGVSGLSLVVGVAILENRCSAHVHSKVRKACIESSTVIAFTGQCV